MPQLNVNIDHVATIRQARKANEPDPVWAAVECELGGASGITMHLREDRRHIQDRDVRLIRETAKVLVNMEMALADSIVRFALQVKPDQVTLVPERRAELTTEGGLDCTKNQRKLASVISRMKKAGIVVSAFILPDVKQVAAAAQVGCDAVELHTGKYAHAGSAEDLHRTILALENARDAGWDKGLVVHAGHGLTYNNIGPVAGLEGLEDFNIGHSIVARSVFVGIRQATREMIALIDKYAGQPLE